MKHPAALLHKWTLLLLAALKPLGFWGAGAIAVIDSSSLPLPMDVLIATWVWNDGRHAALYVLLASAGSALGGLVPFLLGRAGGEVFLLQRIDRARYERMRDRFSRQEFAALFLPSCLPPPTPWKLFVFAAGVFEMRIGLYALAVFAGRCVRFGVEAVLVHRYGPEVVNAGGRMLHDHLAAFLTTLGILLIALAVWALRKNGARRARRIAAEAD